MNFILLSLTVLLLLSFNANLLEAKKMWGSRKKKDPAASDTAPEGSATKFQLPKRRKSAPSILETPMGIFGGSPDVFEASFFEYFGMAEDMLESGEFTDLLKPEALRAVLEQIPNINEVPELVRMMNSPEFSDPAVVRSTLRAALAAVRVHAREFFAALKDPAKLEVLLGEAPESLVILFRALMSGDINAIKDLVRNMKSMCLCILFVCFCMLVLLSLSLLQPQTYRCT
jgi:hypothetical protein